MYGFLYLGEQASSRLQWEK